MFVIRLIVLGGCRSLFGLLVGLSDCSGWWVAGWGRLWSIADAHDVSVLVLGSTRRSCLLRCSFVCFCSIMFDLCGPLLVSLLIRLFCCFSRVGGLASFSYVCCMSEVCLWVYGFAVRIQMGCSMLQS